MISGDRAIERLCDVWGIAAPFDPLFTPEVKPESGDVSAGIPPAAPIIMKIKFGAVFAGVAPSAVMLDGGLRY